MEYKGYRAAVEFDAEDNIFIGKIFGIKDMVSFEGTSVKELERGFKEAVDDYVEHCKKVGKQPDKEFNGRVLVRMQPDQHRWLAAEAETKHKSINDIILNRVFIAHGSKVTCFDTTSATGTPSKVIFSADLQTNESSAQYGPLEYKEQLRQMTKSVFDGQMTAKEFARLVVAGVKGSKDPDAFIDEVFDDEGLRKRA